jgi:hypothetical protein
MDNLIKTGKGILYYTKREIIFTQEDLNKVRKTIFAYE